MANKINFITGETYTLSELFSGDRRIIIPDLQRDYCWGNENNEKSTGERGELVTDFVKNLLEQFVDSKNKFNSDSLNLGLFYGYEVPANHIQLCDGQQRLTTLYLLLGMITKRTGKFRHHLISDFEFKHDDKEPYLNYAIRESSLYFLSDLVCKFFIDNNDNVSQIKTSGWYFDEYNLDPSIQNIINALIKIEGLLQDTAINLSEFGDWMLNKLTFLYFDMENRRNGEETFVVINTTGEPLSATQNLKPLVVLEGINNTYKNADRHWEEIETWFWKHRSGDNDTADAGFSEFLRWVSIIEQVDVDAPEEKKTTEIIKLHQLILKGKECSFPYKTISFETIYSYWQALVWLVEQELFVFQLDSNDDYLSPSWKEIDKTEHIYRYAITQAGCFVLLPVLKYVKESYCQIINDAKAQRNARRIYEFFNNVIRIENVSKAVNSLVGQSIIIVDYILNNGGDIMSLVTSSNSYSFSKQILSDEEKLKLGLSDCTDRETVEETFWSAQEHKIWSGEILPLVEWSMEEGKFNIDLFVDYMDKFAGVFEGECNANIDLVRRALITRGLKDYPMSYGSNLSFCWSYDDWNKLINNNKSEMKAFLDDIRQGISLQQMIDGFVASDKNLYGFAKYPDMLCYCQQKNIQTWDKSWCLVKRVRASSYIEYEAFCLYLDYRGIATLESRIAMSYNDGIDYRGWKVWLYEWKESPLVFERNYNRDQNIVIDVYYGRKKENDWVLQFFLRNNETGGKTELETIALRNHLEWNGERYEKKDLSRQETVGLINKLLSSSFVY